MTGTWLITGARPLGGDPADVLIRDGVIAEIGRAWPRRPRRPGRARSAWTRTGLIVLPGLVDLHAHLREPGREDAETVATGTAAAALGGFTAVHAMANTEPVADTAGVVEQIWRLGRQAGRCDVQPVGAVTVGLGGSRLAELGAMADSAARVRLFSDDGRCVHDAVLMRRALEYVKAFGGVIAQHAQEPRLTEGAQVNEGEISARLGLTGWPAVAEEAIIARDCLLAAHVGSALHVCHVSTAGSVEIIRWAKSKGWQVTAEVTPHHLLLTEELRGRLRPGVQGQPAAAHRGGRRRAAGGPGRRDHRLRRHRPRAAPAGGQGDRVAGGGVRHDRAGDRAARGARGDGRARACSTGPAWPTGCRPGPPRSAASSGHGRLAAGRARPTWCCTTRPRARRWTPAAHASKSRNTPFAGHGAARAG